MKKFFKQPNGMYCYFSYNGVERYDLTEKDIIDLFVQEAKDTADYEIKNAKNFGGIIEELLYRKYKESDEWLKHIGFTESYDDLVKYVPRYPKSTEYVSCNFATYGKCPSCGGTVQNGIGFKQEKCKCGQRLKWE